MEKLVELLRRQALLARDLKPLLKDLGDALKVDATGVGVTALITRMEQLLADLRKLQKEQDAVIAEERQPNMAALLGRMSTSRERDVAGATLKKVQGDLAELRGELNNVVELLEREKRFVDFQMNVLAQTTAETTYAASGADTQKSQRLFEAGI